ncbi:MAG TPA: amidohydrolase family protein [Longimicrobiales bacterium]|nr:amidohydrolase family protein [Longimicrobiales bacterium]
MRHHGGTMTRREAVQLLGLAAGAGLLGCAAPSQQTAVIRTLQGDLAPDALPDGPVLFHEHLSMQLGDAPSFMADVDLMVSEVKAAQADGVAAIVDGGHPDMMRDIEALRRITRETGMPIVASGGYYMQRTYPPEIASRSAEEIADALVAEAARDGLGAFGEIGQQQGVLTADERKVFRAVALAHVRTGLPVFTHNAYSIRATDVPRDAALRQLDILEEAGADLAHVCIGHMCCLDDPRAEILTQIARRGAWVGFDRVTLNATMPDENRVVAAMALIEAGYADKLLLSSDFYSQRSTRAAGGPGLAQTVTVFAPMLRAAGLAEETLRSILVDNPRRFLAFVPRQAE